MILTKENIERFESVLEHLKKKPDSIKDDGSLRVFYIGDSDIMITFKEITNDLHEQIWKYHVYLPTKNVFSFDSTKPDKIIIDRFKNTFNVDWQNPLNSDTIKINLIIYVDFEKAFDLILNSLPTLPLVTTKPDEEVEAFDFGFFDKGRYHLVKIKYSTKRSKIGTYIYQHDGELVLETNFVDKTGLGSKYIK